MAHLVQHHYNRLNSILLGTCFKHFSFRSLRYTEMDSSVFETLQYVPELTFQGKLVSSAVAGSLKTSQWCISFRFQISFEVMFMFKFIATKTK